jgi:hypothetical protein
MDDIVHSGIWDHGRTMRRIHDRSPRPDRPGTGASRGIGRAIAVALARADCDVAVNSVERTVVAPALIETEIARNNPRARPDKIPVGRFGQGEEVADMIVAIAGNGYVIRSTSMGGGISREADSFTTLVVPRPLILP